MTCKCDGERCGNAATKTITFDSQEFDGRDMMEVCDSHAAWGLKILSTLNPKVLQITTITTTTTTE